MTGAHLTTVSEMLKQFYLPPIRDALNKSSLWLGVGDVAERHLAHTFEPDVKIGRVENHALLVDSWVLVVTAKCSRCDLFFFNKTEVPESLFRKADPGLILRKLARALNEAADQLIDYAELQGCITGQVKANAAEWLVRHAPLTWLEFHEAPYPPGVMLVVATELGLLSDGETIHLPPELQELLAQSAMG